METKLQTYNDGIIRLYRRKAEDLTVNRNITSLEELDFIIALAYSEASRRQQDMEFAEQNSFSLSEKVKTPRPPADKGLDSQCFAVIGNTLYGVRYIDTAQRELYFYLEKVRELKGNSNGTK